ncbi:hypothetical protein [Cellulophaga omnivescoria]|uniref:hypothetical protein n=1 Tax=Cellulophaga omnivescoria TaxID=1888890 RepID=UPI0022F0388F|nr:hypothetical protein [Cellulophaga omnivescoria]WBU90857.1 hypothetical protein PBN93_07500 [Cellulophaga omnivescoria]
MKKISILIILVTLFSSCKEKKDAKIDSLEIVDEFISRIHTSSMESDLYQILGKTSLEKHNTDFENIDWKSNYWKEFKSETFNMTDLEVLNRYEQRYLSISTAPNTEDSFQFVVGFGTHFERDDPNNPYRKIKLYMTETENEQIPKELIGLFLKKDFDGVKSKLKNFYLMDEIEDLYRNKK